MLMMRNIRDEEGGGKKWGNGEKEPEKKEMRYKTEKRGKKKGIRRYQ